MLKWILQKNLIKESVLQEFRQAFADLLISYEEVNVIPFSSELPVFSPADINVFYGSTTLMLNAYQNSHFNKGVFFDEEIFTTQRYLKEWGNHLLNNDGGIYTFQKFIQNTVDTKDEWFLRPNADDKSFAGTVLKSQEIKAWYSKIEHLKDSNFHANTKIFASSTKHIQKEWRSFIVNGKVIDISRYMFNGQLNISRTDIPQSVIQFIEERAMEFSPNPIFVMDIALSHSDYKIIECNCFNGTGFYNHNIKSIIKAVSDYLVFAQNP